MRASGSKIIIKPRRSRQPEPADHASSTPELDPAITTDQDQDVVDDDDVGSEVPADSQRGASGSDDEVIGIENGEPTLSIRIRGRGTRGRARATRARGRPRGSGRGRGRGRPKGGPILLRLPKRVDPELNGEAAAEETVDDSQAATPAPANEEVEVVEPIAGGKPFRQVAGRVYVIENDEFVTDDDPKGDAKIDRNGNLLGGRQFKAQTFVLPHRHPERKYMLAIDAARTSGFRDSLYYFRRNLLAFKLNATQAEKDYLIEAGKLGGHLRTRSVTLITARSAYKLHGAKMLLDGKLVVDDYYEEKVLAEITEKGLKAGDPVSDLIEQQALANEAAAIAAGTKTAASGNAEKGARVGLYRTGGPTTIFGGLGWGPFSDGPLNVGRKALLNREGVNEDNWMFVAAEKTMEANQEWAKARKEALRMSRAMQSSIMGDKEQQVKMNGNGESDVARGKRPVVDVEMEDATAGSSNVKKRKKDNKTRDDIIFGAYEAHTGLIHYSSDMQPTKSRLEALPDGPEKRRIMGGTKAGNGAWALAWVDTVMEYKAQDTSQPPSLRTQAFVP